MVADPGPGMRRRHTGRSPLVRQSRQTAAIAGLSGGLAGAWAMDQFTRLWQQFTSEGAAAQRQWIPLPYSQQEWDSTSRTAARAARYLLGREFSCKQRKLGAQFMHFAVGAAGGAMYGAFIDPRFSRSLLSGLLFGATLWLVGEEIAMPLLGINNPPQHYSIADHANSLGEHLIYGITTAVVASLLSQ